MSRLAMAALLICPLLLPAQNKLPADYVNPFIGAINSTKKAGSGHGLGKTFPGAATPFGMVQLSLRLSLLSL
jgi:putative alpha-1,2-mannosidase